MVLQPPCLYYFERNEQAIICGNYILSSCTRLLSAGVTSEFSAITNYPYANSRSKWRQSRKCIIMQINRKSHTVRAHIKKVGVLQRAYRPFSLMKSLCWKRQTLLCVSSVHQTFYSIDWHGEHYTFISQTKVCVVTSFIRSAQLYCLFVGNKMRSPLNNSGFRLCYFHHIVRSCYFFGLSRRLSDVNFVRTCMVESFNIYSNIIKSRFL